MSDFSRRKLLAQGLAATAGVFGLGAAAGFARNYARKYALIPPDHGGIYGLGETLTYASQRLLTRHSLAREFPRSQISKVPFPNEIAPATEAFMRLHAGQFADWRLSVDGLVNRPATFSIDQLKSFPARSQITQLACEEGWSYIAEWTGVPLSHVLDLAGCSHKPDTWFTLQLSRTGGTASIWRRRCIPRPFSRTRSTARNFR